MTHVGAIDHCIRRAAARGDTTDVDSLQAQRARLVAALEKHRPPILPDGQKAPPPRSGRWSPHDVFRGPKWE